MRKLLRAGLAVTTAALLVWLGVMVWQVRSVRGQQPAGTFTGIPFGTVLPGSCNPAVLTINPFFYLTSQSGSNNAGFYSCGPGGVLVPGAPSPFTAPFAYVTADFTTSATSLTNITGLTWTMPANVAINLPFECHMAYSQATAAAADAFGIQDVTVAPTNLFATGIMNTNTTASTQANLPALTTTTATNIVSATPSAATTVWNVDLHGLIQQPSNTSSSAINIMVLSGSGSDAITVKQGSYCTWF